MLPPLCRANDQDSALYLDHRRDHGAQVPLCEPIDELLEGRGHPPFVLINGGLAAEPCQFELAVVGGPAVRCAQVRFVFVSNAGQRYVLLQVRAEGLKPTKRRGAGPRSSHPCRNVESPSWLTLRSLSKQL